MVGIGLRLTGYWLRKLCVEELRGNHALLVRASERSDSIEINLIGEVEEDLIRGDVVTRDDYAYPGQVLHLATSGAWAE